MHLNALIEFLGGLEQNNNRPWFAWNKPAYDLLREEFEALLIDVIARVAKFDRGLGPVDAHKAMFRIYRDTRFYKDKTPYKTHFSAAIRDRAKRGLEPGYYFEIDHRGVLQVVEVHEVGDVPVRQRRTRAGFPGSTRAFGGGRRWRRWRR